MFLLSTRRISRVACSSLLVKSPMEGFGLFAAFAGLQIAVVQFRGNEITVRNFSSSEESETSSKKVKKSPIYTRTGDAGTTSLYNGERRSKTDLVFHALGNVDELNAALGVAREYCLISGNGMEEKITDIQSRLFDLGAAIATPVNNSSEEKLKYTSFPKTYTIRMEGWIDQFDSQLPKLTNFILPSGGLASTHLNLARAICRRAERSVVPLIKDGYVDDEVGRYLNRLSDFLFVAARTATAFEKKSETIWRKS